MYNCKLLTLQASTDLAASFNSSAIDCTGADAIGMEYSFAGLANSTATLKVQTSLTGLNWCDYPDAAHTLLTTNDHGFFYIPNVKPALKVRVVYTANTNTSGSLTLVYVIWVPRSGDSPGPN